MDYKITHTINRNIVVVSVLLPPYIERVEVELRSDTPRILQVIMTSSLYECNPENMLCRAIEDMDAVRIGHPNEPIFVNTIIDRDKPFTMFVERYGYRDRTLLVVLGILTKPR